MFKKSAHIVLTLLLLAATIGMAVSRHYCAGELIAVSLYSHDDGCCNGGDCCSNETQFYQVKDSFSVPALQTIPATSFISIMASAIVPGFNFNPAEFLENDHLSAESPPLQPLSTNLALRQVYRL